MRIDVRGTSRAVRLGAIVVALSATSGCTDWAGYDLDSFWGTMPVLGMMRTSVALDPYDMPRHPAPNTVPVDGPMGDVPPQFPQAQLDSAAATLTNPFAGSTDEAVLARGKVLYERQCSVCHGDVGEGDGTVVGPGKYPFAPPINGAATAGRSDGYIYAVTTAGRGLMPPYNWALTNTDRWAVVNYVRELQRQGTVTPASAEAPEAGSLTTPSAPAGTQPQTQ